MMKELKPYIVEFNNNIIIKPKVYFLIYESGSNRQ